MSSSPFLSAGKDTSPLDPGGLTYDFEPSVLVSSLGSPCGLESEPHSATWIEMLNASGEDEVDAFARLSNPAGERKTASCYPRRYPTLAQRIEVP